MESRRLACSGWHFSSDADPFSRSSMSSSLGGSMGGSCLQQRAEGYPAYVFHEPLHSLTQSYSHAHSAAAHSQPHRGIPTSHGGTPTTPGGQPAGPGGAPYQPTTSTATGEFPLKDCLFVLAESSRPSTGTRFVATAALRVNQGRYLSASGIVSRALFQVLQRAAELPVHCSPMDTVFLLRLSLRMAIKRRYFSRENSSRPFQIIKSFINFDVLSAGKCCEQWFLAGKKLEERRFTREDRTVEGEERSRKFRFVSRAPRHSTRVEFAEPRPSRLKHTRSVPLKLSLDYTHSRILSARL